MSFTEPPIGDADFQVIDGHATKDAFRFAVRGDADCDAGPSSPPDLAAPDEDEDDGGPMTLIALFAGATVLMVVVALALRGRKS